MSTQNANIHLVPADGVFISTPELNNATVFRGDEAFGDGIYRAKMSDGTIEVIGGPGAMSSMEDWHITGNAGTVDGVNFLGTTDNVPLSFRVNNVQAGRIDNTLNNVFFGYLSGSANITGTENTGIGHNALLFNTDGIGNTAVGYEALYSNTIGVGNTAIGFDASKSNTLGDYNVANGFSALFNNTTAGQNVAIGAEALFTQSFSNLNTAWFSDNVAIGFQALRINQPTSTTTGYRNTAIGTTALDFNTTGSSNTAIGYNADVTVATLTNATAIGANAAVSTSNSLVLGSAASVGIGTSSPTSKLHIVGIGTTFATISFEVFNAALVSLFKIHDSGQINAGVSSNLFIGLESGDDLTTATGITAIGFHAGASVTSDVNSTFVGSNAGTLTVGSIGYNTFIGSDAGMANITGFNNTFIGSEAGLMSTSSESVMVGRQAGRLQTTSSQNVYIGVSAGTNNDASNNVMVGNLAGGSSTGADTSTFIGREAFFSNVTGDGSVGLGYRAGYYETVGNKLFIDNVPRANEADGRVKAMIYGVFAAATTNQFLTVNGHILTSEDLQFTTKVIDVTAGDTATINSPAGRFRKDTSGSTFTLTNSYITANSIILLQYASDPGITGFDNIIVAGAGSAVITFTTSGAAAAPTSDVDMNFLIIN